MRAVVLAAGEGIRTRPLTHARPKVMLPVGNRPILEHVLAALHVAEIHDVTLVVGFKAESIQTYFQDGERFGVRIRYVRQPKPVGTADALARGLAASKGKDDVIVVPGDNYLSRQALKRFLQTAGEHDALLYTTTDDPQRYGVLELNDDFVRRVQEKPPSASQRTISTGILKVRADRADLVKKHVDHPEVGLIDWLNELAKSRDRLRAVALEGYWYDVDRPENLLGANALHLAEETGGIQGTVEPGASLVGSVRVGKGSRIRSGAYLVGPITVGEGCEIGPQTVIYGPTSIGNNVSVGPFTEILECVIMDDARIASGCSLHHAVLDRGVILASRVVMDKATALPGPRFGAVVGDGTVLGNGVVLQPGTVVGVNARIAAQKTVGAVADNARVV